MTSTTMPRSGVAGALSTRTLLAAGIATGPLFGVVATAQVLTRDGFDLSRQPLSLLALGEHGWIQVANFVLTGLLALAGAAGLRRALRGTVAGKWGPALVAVFGVGLVVAGAMPSDPSMGWPAGAPEGSPDSLSWHAVGHGVGAMLAFGSLTIACLVFARRYLRTGRRGWAVFSLACALATVVVMAWPDQDSISVRMALGSVFIFGWLTAVSAQTRTERNH
ncbi:uncharacterized protein DUF998 [Micromonospora kangleipakensis]|uniref:Uncharacterized protein DUF998 n=1 Tax=Micromonospora kangleipakensis TaxID=1077942 RepID=A0A4Q8B7G5_9ACTN|nr:DUF998 domain-containing protein [Micromonospora kangleipakensis]RZU73612.1 uncharacterized protein DUF998 [Micromonospora kangleipakensis]